jgi:CDP-glucose 4,6-dehydratase
MVERANPTSDPGATHFSWQGRKVFLTGHTGFKGGWLALFLTQLGATVRGYALDPSSEPNLLTVARVGSVIEDIRGDVRDAVALERAMREFAPEVVFHLAAQPIVRLSYEDPIGTMETNVIGTARVLDTVRRTPSVAAVVCVTSDKCYENKEWIWPYRETDPLGGYDPYSASKACAEIVCATFRQSYFPIDTLGQSNSHGVAIASARAGNVIGGGDWSVDRLIPDLVRGFLSGQPVGIRRPHAIRPWQHVLEPLHGYIRLAEKLLTHNPRFASAYNFGPAQSDARPVSWIAEQMAAFWGNGASWVLDKAPFPHEAGYLKLDSSRAYADLGWSPQLNLQQALELLVGWYRAWQTGSDMHTFTLNQIEQFRAHCEK